MAERLDPKREKKFEIAREIAAATGQRYLDPTILFNRASDDDLKLYTPDMLAHSAMHSATELAKWNGKAPQVSISPIANVEPGGVAVSVLSVTDHNMPFLYESVMGEVTSSYRDLSMAVHPILVMKKESLRNSIRRTSGASRQIASATSSFTSLHDGSAICRPAQAR
jgi:glutamate dehydrogenase